MLYLNVVRSLPPFWTEFGKKSVLVETRTQKKSENTNLKTYGFDLTELFFLPEPASHRRQVWWSSGEDSALESRRSWVRIQPELISLRFFHKHSGKQTRHLVLVMHFG